MARTPEEWSGLLGSALSKMALVRGTDSPNAYLPEDCYRVIARTFDVALEEARAEGRAAAMAEMKTKPARPREAANNGMIRLVIRALPLARSTA